VESEGSWQSKNVRLDNVRVYYLSNFGVVGQVSENISIHRCWFAPEEGSGRTNAGFADFVQMSGCRGLIDITDTKFAGAHDDPINVHGTHLQIVRATSANTLLLRYMHHQTFGFQSFHSGDDIEIVNPETLLAEGTFKVKNARMVSPREIEITLTKPVPAFLRFSGLIQMIEPKQRLKTLLRMVRLCTGPDSNQLRASSATRIALICMP
jgi:hypothetical protein